LTSEEARIPANPPNPKKRYGDLKPNLALIPGSASVHMALGLEDGADKYGPFNWRDDPVEAMVYIAACKRHIDEWMDGEDCARDSGAHHLGHAIASLAILIDAMECGTLIDNRPTPGAVSDLIEEVAAQRECAEDQEWVEYKSDNLREADMEPDGYDWQADAIGSYHEAIRAIGEDVKAGRRELPAMFRPRNRPVVGGDPGDETNF
jgi:hypothetical protein